MEHLSLAMTRLLLTLTRLRDDRDERGDVPGWVLITVMTAGLVMAIWGVAREQLGSMLRAAVHDYLAAIGAYGRYPGLTFDVVVDAPARRVSVTVHAPLDLPLTVPGSPQSASIGATGAAVVQVDPYFG